MIERVRRFRHDDDRGAIIIITAVLMVGLLGVTAIVFDLGHKRELKRDLQTTADAAALAGVQALAAGDSGPTEAQNYVGKNGYTTATINFPPVSGAFAGNDTCIEVIPSETFDAAFAPVIGRDDLTAQARAVACMTLGEGGNYAIFAGSETCGDKTLKFNGSVNETFGSVHSNGDLDISGSNNSYFDGNVTYVGDLEVGGSSNTFPPGDPSQVGVQPWPIEFDINDFKPGGAAAIVAGSEYHSYSGDIKSDNLPRQGGKIRPGIYYTKNGDVDISDSDEEVVGGGGVTFVTENGLIKLSGSDHKLQPYFENLLVFSNRGSPSCDEAAMDMSGSNHDWKGIIYAPRGQVKLAGSTNTSLSGSVVSYTVEMSGSSIDLIADLDDDQGKAIFFLAE